MAATEYAVILAAFVAAALIGTWLFGHHVGDAFSQITGQVPEPDAAMAGGGATFNPTHGSSVQAPNFFRVRP